MSSLNPTMRISTQLIDVIRTHLGLSRRQARNRAIHLLERVGIPDAPGRIDAYPHEFSGGMRQRVMIAIAVACNPQLVIADEPTTALDVTIQAQIVELMHDLRDELGLALIWITHDLGVVAGLADRVAVMYAGKLVEISDVGSLYTRPLHPYTIGLLDALPKMGDRADRLTSIPGLPPDLAEEPTRCPFADRCPHVFDRCRSEVPTLIEPVHGRHVACFYDIEAGTPRHG
ncbi:Oligopeptide transport ATP-binding protein OppD [Geodia barretti]|nr:Oligopeptide transport ATP-binding protein OppD [Geodia barretti]